MATVNRSSWPKWARALTTGWVLSPIIVIVVIAAVFEGYGWYTRSQPTNYSQGGAFQSGPISGGGSNAAKTAPQGSTTGKPGKRNPKPGTPKGDKSAVAAASQGATSPTASAEPSQRASATATSSSQASPTDTAGSAPTSSAPTTTLPAVGTYTLDVSGYEQPKFGPVSACKNEFPSSATLDVHSSGAPDSYDFDLRLYPGTPNKHDERHIYKYSPTSVVLTYEQETVTCSGIKQSTTVSYSPAQTRVELPLKVGNSWHNHGGGSSRTETGTSKVVSQSTMSVQGHSYTVYEIDTDLTMTGSESGTRVQKWWYAPQLGMYLKFSETTNGKRSGASYYETYTATVASMPSSA